MLHRRIAIVGCGYVGSALGAELARLGHDVRGTTTSPERLPVLQNAGISPVLLELAQEDRLHDLLADREAVYLMVAPGRHGREYREVYLEGVEHLLRAAGDTPVRQIVYTSSTSVYAQQDGSWVDEASPTEPESESGRILVSAEQELRRGVRGTGMVATVLRLSGIVGPDRGPITRVREWAGRSRDDGEEYVNLIHRDDIVAACLALLEHPYDGVLNLSSDDPLLRREYYDRLLEIEALPPINWTPAASGRRGKRVRSDRIREALGLKLKHPSLRP